MQKSEQNLQNIHQKLKTLESDLVNSQESLNTIETPTTGRVSDLLSSHTLLNSQRYFIQQNQQAIVLAKEELHQAKEQLKRDMIEYEKYKYLDLEEIKEMLKKKRREEAKDLDEIALMTYEKKSVRWNAS